MSVFLCVCGMRSADPQSCVFYFSRLKRLLCIAAVVVAVAVVKIECRRIQLQKVLHQNLLCLPDNSHLRHFNMHLVSWALRLFHHLALTFEPVSLPFVLCASPQQEPNIYFSNLIQQYNTYVRWPCLQERLKSTYPELKTMAERDVFSVQTGERAIVREM